jgi:hypothetical protein
VYVLGGMLDELKKVDQLTDERDAGASLWNERLVLLPDRPTAHQAEGCDGTYLAQPGGRQRLVLAARCPEAVSPNGCEPHELAATEQLP